MKWKKDHKVVHSTKVSGTTQIDSYEGLCGPSGRSILPPQAHGHATVHGVGSGVRGGQAML